MEELDMKAIRLKLRRTRKQMAELLGVPLSRINGWETRGNYPANDSIMRLRSLGIVDNLNRFDPRAFTKYGLYD